MHDESVDKRCGCRFNRGTGADSAGYQPGRMRLHFFGQRSLKEKSFSFLQAMPEHGNNFPCSKALTYIKNQYLEEINYVAGSI